MELSPNECFDPLENLLHLETMFEELGKVDGLNDGRAAGFNEGKMAGFVNGYEIGILAGLCEGFSETLGRIMDTQVTRPSRRIQIALNQLHQLSSSFPMANTPDADFVELRQKLLSRIRQVISLLSLDASLQTDLLSLFRQTAQGEAQPDFNIKTDFSM